MRRENGHPAVCYTWRSRVPQLRASDRPRSVYSPQDSLNTYTQERDQEVAATDSIVAIDADGGIYLPCD